MSSTPSGQNGLLPRRTRRVRLTLMWAAFGLTALGLAYAVHRLYETVRREFQEQGEVAMTQQQAKTAERVRAATDAVRHATIKSLAALHVEGLGYALRQWDENEATIVGTFLWEEGTGFLPSANFPAGSVKQDELAGLWSQLRAWRAQHPNANSATSAPVGSSFTGAVRTIDNPFFSASELGYQAENLEMLRYAGRPVDPWAGWASPLKDPAAPWVFWYQAGPGAPVRGCFVNIAPVLAQVRSELADSRLARIELVTDQAPSPGPDQRARVRLAAALPGYSLVGSHGDLFVEKQSEARLAALVIVLLLGIFVVGAVFLAIFSQREIRDAEHKTTFVTQVSHELRTPLTSIQMFADMLVTPALPNEKRVRFAGTIARESKRLSALIERLLTFNALEKGGPAPLVEPVDVVLVVRETLEEMEATLRAAGMQAESELPNESVTVTTDRSALKQALLNLLDNALKYACDGRVIHLVLIRTTDEMRLRVADKGPGIPRELGGRVFEPFVQGGRRLTDKSPGVGLGLSIARGGLRRAHGDLVLCPSEKGAVFEIRLPLAPPS